MVCRYKVYRYVFCVWCIYCPHVYKYEPDSNLVLFLSLHPQLLHSGDLENLPVLLNSKVKELTRICRVWKHASEDQPRLRLPDIFHHCYYETIS